MTFQDRVYKVVSQIPKGSVLTYGEVARRAGSPRAARAVGNIMNKNPFDKRKVPCHRVVKGDGTVGGYRGNPSTGSGPAEKIRLLKAEGVPIKNGKINLLN